MTKAAIISIGDELLIGQTINTNASWLGKKLNENGIVNKIVLTTQDEKKAITSALSFAMQNADIVLLTGGLGPTKDDITKKTLTDYFGGKLIMNQDLMDSLVSYFKGRNRPLLDSNKLLAMVPDNCELIINKKGTAAGMIWKVDEKIIVSMPGVPYEMKGMMLDNVFPKLHQLFTLQTITHKTLMIAGLGETLVAEKIKNIEAKLPDYIKLAFLPNLGNLRLRLSGFGTDKTKLQNEIDDFGEQMKLHLKGYYYGEDEVPLTKAIQNIFTKNGLKLALAESCTGGDICAEIVKNEGSSKYFKGGIVAYDYDIKSNILGVDKNTIEAEGAVSEAVVKQMASNALTKLNANYAIGVSGIAGPSGGLPDKPVGTVWMGFASKKEVFAKKMIFPLQRAQNIKLTTNYALNNLLNFVKRELD